MREFLLFAFEVCFVLKIETYIKSLLWRVAQNGPTKNISCLTKSFIQRLTSISAITLVYYERSLRMQ